MKNKITLVIISVLISFQLLAEDIIVLRNGNIIKAKVIEVGSAEIKFHKITNINGPLYVKSINEILSITYENGETDKFETSDNISPQKGSQILVERKVDIERNKQLLEQYKAPHDYYGNKKPSTETTEKGTAFFAFTDNSVLSNEDIEMTVIPHRKDHFSKRDGYVVENPGKYGTYYEIQLENKTDHNLYIDCASCFTINYDGSANSFFDSRSFSTQKGGSKTGIFNLGGLAQVLGAGELITNLASATNIGASSSSGLTVTESSDRILIIPPKGKMSLPTKKYVGKNKVFERYEYFYRPSYPEVTMYKWKPQYFEEGELPFFMKFIISYSDDPTFGQYSCLTSELYCYEIMGELYKPSFNIDFKLHNNVPSYVIFKRMDSNGTIKKPIY